MNRVLVRYKISLASNFLIRPSLDSSIKSRVSGCLSCKSYHSAANFQPKILQTCSYLPNYSQQRWKKKRQSGKNVEDVESDESDDEIETEPGSKVSKVAITSLRADLVLKACLGLARNKVEVLFYGGNVRVNDEKLKKKSDSVKIGDVIDVITGPSKENPDNFVYVSRIEILGAQEKDATRLTLHFNKHVKLLVQK